MWRTRAVISMLMEDIAGLGRITVEDEDDHSEEAVEEELLNRAIRRAGLVIVVDCLAILILFLFRDQAQPFLPLQQTTDTVFTVGVLAVAAHAGFRGAQLERLRAVRRVCLELRERQQP